MPPQRGHDTQIENHWFRYISFMFSTTCQVVYKTERGKRKSHKMSSAFYQKNKRPVIAHRKIRKPEQFLRCGLWQEKMSPWLTEDTKYCQATSIVFLELKSK